MLSRVPPYIHAYILLNPGTAKKLYSGFRIVSLFLREDWVGVPEPVTSNVVIMG
jgi:hypothetical protein